MTTRARVGVWSGLHQLSAMPQADWDRFVTGVESLGFGSLWFGENLAREAMVQATLALARTDRIHVGTGIANIWARDAAAMANGANSLAVAFPGRFVLGIGVSHKPIVSPRGHEYRTPFEILESYIRDMNQATWLGPSVEQPPRVLGAQGPRMARLAATELDGIHPYLITPEYTAVLRDLVGPDALIVAEQGVALAPSPSEARAAARRHLGHYLELDNYCRSFLRQGFSEADLEGEGSDRLVDGLIGWGSPDDIAERVAAHLAAGADEVVIQVLPGEGEQLLDILETLAPTVLSRAGSA